MSSDGPLRIRRFAIDLAPISAARLERLKATLDASSYTEVIRLALRELETRVADEAARCESATTGATPQSRAS